MVKSNVQRLLGITSRSRIQSDSRRKKKQHLWRIIVYLHIGKRSPSPVKWGSHPNEGVPFSNSEVLEVRL